MSRSMLRVAFGLVLAVALAAPAGAGAGPRSERRGAVAEHRVIVQAATATQAADAVLAVGGRVTRALPLVDGVAATVAASAVGQLERRPGVIGVTPDDPVEVQGSTSNAPAASSVASAFIKEVKAHELWKAGYTGRGVTVALLDTGIDTAHYDAPGDDLYGYVDAQGTHHRTVVPLDAEHTTLAQREAAGGDDVKVDCVNLVGDGDCDDHFGHGTFMAGLIAGSGRSSGGKTPGVAPDAQLVSIKAAGKSGATDVSTIIAGIQWTVSFADEYAIDVLNLSLGTDSRRDYKKDPLNVAVQRAWDAGITVVVAASNRGHASENMVTKPGDDPLVLTVGALDDRGTPGTDDDLVPRFTAAGPSRFEDAHVSKPDVVAPGTRVVSLRAAGGEIDTAAPVDDPTAVYRRGSGTSMAAAITSGVAALVIDRWNDDDVNANDKTPEARGTPTRPDQVKEALRRTAREVANSPSIVTGKGLIDAYQASQFGAFTPDYQLKITRAEGTEELAASRNFVTVAVHHACPLTASLSVVDQLQSDTCALDGDYAEYTAQLKPWESYEFSRSAAWSPGTWAGSSWYGSSWYGSSWYGSSWYGSSWYEDGNSHDQEGNEKTPFGTVLPGSAFYGAWE